MRLLDIFRSQNRDQEDQNELRSLRDKVVEGREERQRLITAAPIPSLAAELIDFEGLFSDWQLPQQPTVADVVRLTQVFKHILSIRQRGEVGTALAELLGPLARYTPPQSEGEDFGLSIAILDRLENPAAEIERIVKAALRSPFRHLAETVQENVLLASKIDPARPSSKPLVMPTEAKDTAPSVLIETYLKGTPFVSYLQRPHPFAIPFKARFEHAHIIGGSGHGKTQLLQSLILKDLEKLGNGQASIIVIDSQGDMLRNILSLASVGQMMERVVLIDPNDIEYPPALNLFDFGLDRLQRYNPVEREKLYNGAIALYEYLFGALLGAELTMRQGVIFRYLARMLMTIPGATIHTMLELVENPEATQAHFQKLDRMTRHFYETQFPSPAFKDTRQQILARLWGVISNSVLERMFANEKNKLDLFDAMNRGSIILINTAKDLLKQDGCEILGRFFIALICQAAQERASIPENKRRSTFVYIDEAHDYFDESIENLFNQARKYHVGLIIAHQNLDQFDAKLRSTVMASTSIKMVGGLSASDAGAFAKEMNCEREFLQGMRKRQNQTQFACFVRNHTERPVSLTVPFGQMESRPKLSASEKDELMVRNRLRYGASSFQSEYVRPTSTLSGIGQPDIV